MEIYARASKDLKQIRIFKQMATFSSRISLSDAKRLHKTGRITKTNLTFDRLVDNDFDVVATLGWYQAERERLAKEKSSTDET